MNKSFYPKLAVSNIIKNKKTYFPYILTCMFTVMMYYMITSIIDNKNFKNIYSAENLKMLLNIAIAVVTIFAVIFLFYTNSFLMKRRRKEIGLYNILGMEKRHIAKMMAYETLIIAGVSMVVGMLLGILFSKLIFLFLLKIISYDVVLGFDVPVKAITATLILFAIIFALTLLYNLGKVHLTKPIELLHGGEIGEKEPKTKIIMTLIGLGTIGWGYWFALTVKSPLSAITLFFLAVILVVIGTYALFTAGSIALLKILRKNKNFYYKTKHFTNVSGMLYRMKQNAVGLANICILSTMVVIMISTTISLYAGINDALAASYPRQIVTTGSIANTSETVLVQDAINEEIIKSGFTAENVEDYHSLTLMGILNGTELNLPDLNDSSTMSNFAPDIAGFELIGVDEYNAIAHTDYTLNNDEVMICSEKNTDAFHSVNITYNGNSKAFQVKSKLKSVPSDIKNGFSKMIPYYYVIVKDTSVLDSVVDLYRNDITKPSDSQFYYYTNFDIDGTNQQISDLSNAIEKHQMDNAEVTSGNVVDGSKDFYGMYGGFVFIGIFLGILFIMATVLIIYYKQISEGFEDKARFEIMQKVGMSHAEVKKSIRSQVVMVFFLPIGVTAIHIAVSFRIIKKLLYVLGLTNEGLFLVCTIVALLAFCIVYGIVFMITAKSYYKIVSTAE